MKHILLTVSIMTLLAFAGLWWVRRLESTRGSQGAR